MKMLKKTISVLLAAIMILALPLGAAGATGEAASEDSSKKTVEARAMYRVYNPNSGEHFYTGRIEERNYLVSVGWNDEGIGWYAPVTSNTPVYRLYNPNAGDHHYTLNEREKNYLVSVGWNDEGIGWYSDDDKGMPLYRQYNPNATAGAHNFTLSKAENDYLVSLGWKQEDIGWYGVVHDIPGKSSEKPEEPGKDEPAADDPGNEEPGKTGNGHIIEIDPGHQKNGNYEKEPIGPGASTTKYKVSSGTASLYNGYEEYELTLAVSLQLKKILEERGYTVFLTRESHDVNISNKERAEKAAADHAEILVRIHANGMEDRSLHGVLNYGPATGNPYLSEQVVKDSQRLVGLLTKYQCLETGQKALSNLFANDMSGINWATMPVSIVEMGFMSNKEEDAFMQEPANQEKIARGIANGIDAYFKGESA